MRTRLGICLFICCFSIALHGQKRFNHEAVIYITINGIGLNKAGFEELKFLDYADYPIEERLEGVEIEFDEQYNVIYYRNKENYVPQFSIVYGTDTMQIRLAGGHSFIQQLEFQKGSYYVKDHFISDQGAERNSRYFDFCKDCPFELYSIEEIKKVEK
jgi:hypothetical protein